MSRPTPDAVVQSELDIEKLLDDFERAWQEGRPAAIEALLAQAARSAPPTGLVELIKMDLEFRWHRNATQQPGESLPHRPYLEDYVRCFPTLGPMERLPLDLVGEEYWVRLWGGDRPTHDEYARRFASFHKETLVAWLTQLDTRFNLEMGQRRPTAVEPAPRPMDVLAFLDLLQQHSLLGAEQLAELRATSDSYLDVHTLVQHLMQLGWLTPFQVNLLLQGRANELFVGPYVLVSRLGKGAMGRIFKGIHRHLRRSAAVKIFRPELIAELDADGVKRFYQEVQAAARLSHPHVVHAYDAGPIASTHFLAMECIEGVDLGQFLRQSGPLPVRQACELAYQTALGLQHAYECGLVHRDIKPHNLMLECRLPIADCRLEDRKEGNSAIGNLKILDLGLARLKTTAGLRSSKSLTLSGDVLGTPDYMAPEQADDPHGADIRADLYSLGCTLYHMLTGRPPFPGGNFLQKINRHRGEEAAPVHELRPDVPAPVAAIVRRLLAKSPDRRFQTPAELARAMQAILSGEAPPAPSKRVPALFCLPGGAWPRWALAGSLCIVVLFGWLLVSLLGGARSDPNRTRDDTKTGQPRTPDKLITNSIGMRLTWISPGKFPMGASETEPGRFPDEGPCHDVTITKGFYLGVYEVTQGQYDKIMPNNPSVFGKDQGKAADLPVDNLTWRDAVTFCEKLSARPSERQAGRTYRLPTEAEWEYACRAGTQTPYSCGKDATKLDQHAWYGVNSQGHTWPVGKQKPNPWGLYDMHGNVWEWCADFYQDHHDFRPQVDPRGPASGPSHVFKGGAYNDVPAALRCAHRYPYSVTVEGHQGNIGFRVACVVKGVGEER